MIAVHDALHGCTIASLPLVQFQSEAHYLKTFNMLLIKAGNGGRAVGKRYNLNLLQNAELQAGTSSVLTLSQALWTESASDRVH